MSREERDLFDSLSTTINIQREPFLVHIGDLLKVLCHVLLHNLDIFMRVYYFQTHELYDRSSKLEFFSTDAGDVYQNFRMMFPAAPYASRVVISDQDFDAILITFSQAIKQFPSIASYVGDVPREQMWEACKWLILPVRINASTVPPSERERMLRLWLSTVFTLPMLDAYTERYSIYPKSLTALRNLYRSLKLAGNGQVETNPGFDQSKITVLTSMDIRITNSFVSPIRANSSTDRTFRTFMYVLLMCCIEVIHKPCPRLKEARSIYPEYSGECMNPLDSFVNEQIKIIQTAAAPLKPGE